MVIICKKWNLIGVLLKGTFDLSFNYIAALASISPINQRDKFGNSEKIAYSFGYMDGFRVRPTVFVIDFRY